MVIYVKFYVPHSINSYSKAGFPDRSKTVNQGQNVTLLPWRSDLNSINGPIEVTVLVGNVQGVYQLSNNSNWETFIDILTEANIGEKVWIEEHAVLVFQKIK